MNHGGYKPPLPYCVDPVTLWSLDPSGYIQTFCRNHQGLHVPCATLSPAAHERANEIFTFGVKGEWLT